MFFRGSKYLLSSLLKFLETRAMAFELYMLFPFVGAKSMINGEVRLSVEIQCHNINVTQAGQQYYN